MIRPVRVLIVDDQEPFRSAAQLVVSLVDGFEVVGEAPTGEDGVRLAAELLPDLVLMDINMPGIDGLEATRRIVSAQPAIRVLVLSTYEAGEYEPLARAAGAVGFVSKSEFGPDHLLAAWPG
jgi:DNA-binding NarL/FixJ family response regulator